MFDDTALALLILIPLAVTVFSIFGFVGWLKTRSLKERSGLLERELRQVRERLQLLEQGQPPRRGEQAAPERPPPLSKPESSPQTEPWATAEPQAERTPAPLFTEKSRVPNVAATATPADKVIGSADAPPGPAVPEGSGRGSIEDKLGGNWTVWIGGLALVLGGVFLVRYSIEAGLLPPVVRVLMGGAFALLLIGLGEIMRRRMPEEPATKTHAYIPGILTLAGVTSAFASAYAAHALYGLIGPAAAFVLMGAVALLTLAASLLHGPIIASVGLVASYGMPFLVSSDTPAMAPLVPYVLFVTLASYALANLRLWRWLAIAAAAATVFWAHILSAMAGPADTLLLALYDLGALGLAAWFLVATLYPRGAERDDQKPDWVVSAILAAHALPVLYLLQIDFFSTVSVATLFITLAALLVLACEWPAVGAAAIAAAALGGLAHLTFEVPLGPASFAPDMAADPVIASALLNPETQTYLHFGLAIAALLAIAGFVGTRRSAARWALAAAGTAGPLAVFGVAYLRTDTAGLEVMFGITALAMGAAFAAATARFETWLPRHAATRDLAVAAYAIATIAALVSGMAILLEEGWLVVGLALITTGIAWVETRKGLPVLRWLAVAVAALCGYVVLREPTIAGDALGTTPVFNWLLYGYGVPTLAFAGTAWLLAWRGKDWPQAIFEALATAFALATPAMLIHHAMNGGDMQASVDTLAESSLLTLLGLAGAIALQMLNERSESKVFEFASQLVGVISFAMIAQVNLFILNPWLTGEDIGTGLLFNVLLPAYLLPALLLGYLYRQSLRVERHPFYILAAGLLTAVLVFAWATLEVRAFFHRPRLDLGAIGDSELYTYSLVWLLLGIALLVAGIATRSRALRAASGAVVALTVGKAFLIDMSNLTGIWRALSFIGLGVVLIGIGALYQRLLRQADSPSRENEGPGGRA